MRIRSLTLDRFGHFTGHRFDFGAAGSGSDFHIVYGPNEAGKTTTMEAALRLLYGFPQREPYDFLHHRKNLQISALLEIDGQERAFTRLPTRNATLTDANGIALPETALAAHLGGLSLEDYRQLLCLDDATIERGGDEIVAAKGDTGRLLFSAAAGISDLSAVLDKVRLQADQLYRKRSSNTEMAALRRDLAEVERIIRDTDITASGWKRLRQTLAEAQADEDAARAARDTLRAEGARIIALRDALPILTEIDALDARLEPLAEYPDRLDINPEDLVRLLTERTRAEGDRDRLLREIAEAETARAGVVRDPAALAQSGALDALEPLLSRYRTAEPDLPKRRAAVADALADMKRALRDLSVPEGTDPQTLVLAPADLSRLEQAREARRIALRDATTEDRECAALADQVAAAEAMIDADAETGTPVSDLLDSFAADSLSPAHATARQAIDTARRRAIETRDALARAGTGFVTLPSCPETPASAGSRAERYQTLGRDIAEAEREAATHRRDMDLHDMEIAQLSQDRGIVGDAEAEARRKSRDTLWRAHRATLDAASADAFEAAMRGVDALTDTRLGQAGELGRLRAAERAKAESEIRFRAAQDRLDALREERGALETEVADAAGAVGLGPMTPEDWRDWVRAHATAAEAALALARLSETHAGTLDKSAALVEALSVLIPMVAPEFDAMLAAARSRAAAERKRGEEQRAAEQALRRLRHERDRREARRAVAYEAARKADATWQETVAITLAGAVEADILEASLEPLRRLRETEALRAQAARQVAGMEADQARFAEGVGALAAALGIEPGASPLETHQALSARVQDAVTAEARIGTLDSTLEERRAQLGAAQSRLAEIESETKTLGALFPPTIATTRLEDLRSAVATAREAIELRTSRSALSNRLFILLDVTGLAAARSALEGHTSAGLAARAATLESDQTAAEVRLSEATEARVNAQRDLRAVTGDADIAVLTERKATLELQIEESALRHLELSFGHRLAEEAIRRYRDSHRSAMMRATEAAFTDLTAGAYTALRTQVDGPAETLLAIDRTGATKSVQDLSKGTRFQLYLALRAAAYEQMAAQGVILPFFCDDIFETFDEERTRAACTLLERIGRTGQAIYLTHHRHVVEIARAACGDKPRLHELPAPR